MTHREMAQLDYNPLFISIVCWWDFYIWVIREMQIAHNKLHQGDTE